MNGLMCLTGRAAGLALICLSPARPLQAASIVDDITGRLPPQRALVVQIGAATPEAAIAFGQRSNTVHAIDAEAPNVQRLTDAVLKAGLSGRVWIDCGPVRVLPYVGNLANVVLVDDLKRMTDQGLDPAEVVRVLAPGGIACIGQRSGTGAGVTADALKKWPAGKELESIGTSDKDGTWALFRKLRPTGMDEWTHEMHDATRNTASQDQVVGVPKQIHWMNGTPYTWQISNYRTAGNRTFFFYDGQKGMSRWATFKESFCRIEAIDAFSGIQLWNRTYQAPVKGFYPIVEGDRIIFQVGEEVVSLNAVNGDKQMVYTEAAIPYAGVVSSNVLFSVRDEWVRAVDLDTGKLLWKIEPENGSQWVKGKQLSGWRYYNPMLGDGMVLMFEAFFRGGNSNKPSERIVGLDSRTGAKVWTFDDPVIDGHHKRAFFHQGRIYLSTPKALVTIPTAKDKQVCVIPVTNKGREPSWNFFAVNGLLWTQESPTFVVGDTIDTTKPQPPKAWVGLDPESGKVVKRYAHESGIPGWRGRCYADQGSPSYIVSWNNEFLDLKTGEMSNLRIFRGHCGWGPLAGNGFFYGTPTWCIFCYPALFGGIASSPNVPPPSPVPDDQRLEKGPAYTATPPAGIPASFPPDAWPTYRQNSKRTAGTTTPIAMPLAAQPIWKQVFGEKITGTVVAGGRVYVAVVNQGRIVAMDEKTGAVLWTSSGGPRIDSPPTLYGDLLLFGSHDGRIHALRASDGALAWRLTVAPDRRRMVCTDRVESAWPLPGAILIHEGVLYAMAGRITGADGGMHLCAVDPQTGVEKWHRVVARTTNPKLATGGDPKLYYWKEPEGQLANNHLIANETSIRLPDQHFVWDFRTDNGEQIIPDKVQGTQLSTFSSRWPWLGYDRPTFSYTFHGMEIHPEFRHPYEAGTIMSFPATNAVGIVCKRIRGQFTELIATKVDDAAKNWDGKTRGEVPWKPIQVKTDVFALITAGETAFIGGMDFVLRPEKGRIVAISMRDGTETQQIELPGLPTYDGLAAANGKLFVSLQDGTIMCMSKVQ